LKAKKVDSLVKFGMMHFSCFVPSSFEYNNSLIIGLSKLTKVGLWGLRYSTFNVNKTADVSEFVIDICLFNQRIKFADSLAHKF